MKNLQGFRTILLNVLLATAIFATEQLQIVDWESTVGTSAAIGVAAVLNIVMRWLTTTPVGVKEE